VEEVIVSKSQTSQSIEVDVPVSTAYNQWTQFEEFPRFMGGVEQVVQKGADMVWFKVNVGGRTVEYDARIVEQTPDKKIVWRSVSGKKTGGMVEFENLGASKTRVTLDLMYEPEGALENIGDMLGFVSNRAKQDLANFKEFIESRQSESGAWRGEIHSS
jgi:uncharacterized membrane protein